MTLLFKKLLKLSDLPSDWSIVRIAIDWQGRPLVLAAEGKPQRPKSLHDIQAWTKWRISSPRVHHLIYQDGGSDRSIRFQQSNGITACHIQPFGDGWLLGESRGRCGLYDNAGLLLTTLDLGDASEDIQTTPDGRIWVSYFDEGVFGGSIGNQGLVCFDRDGDPIFRYAEFAEKMGLPFIADCYAMNVCDSRDVWLNYYTDFPLVHLRDDKVERIWLDFGSVGNSFAIRDENILYSRGENFFSQSLAMDSKEIPIEARDENGVTLTALTTPYLGIVGRGPNLLLNSGTAIYGLVR